MMVSIPVGFFQALQQKVRNVFAQPFSVFQSLSGFFRPCNRIPGAPICLRLPPFQSLSGFFRPCNRASRDREGMLG